MMSSRKTKAVAAASADVEAAGDELLARGNAVDAVVAGVFAAAAVHPGVLLGPVQLLLGGPGSGLLAIDGRVRQPGIGAPRPRGFTADEDIPDAARVGVPWLPAALFVATAAAGTATFGQVLGPALALAKGTPRHEPLRRLVARGPRAMEERGLGSELLASAGRPSGGLLTPEDLASPAPQMQKASVVRLAGGDGSRQLVRLPWAHSAEEADGAPTAPVSATDVALARACVAVDRFGNFALACWSESHSGLMVEELGLRAPFYAEPVLRGKTRLRPSEVRPAAAPAALVMRASPEMAFAAFGAGDAYDVLLGALRGYVDGDRVEAHGEARLIAVAHASGAASVFRS